MMPMRAPQSGDAEKIRAQIRRHLVRLAGMPGAPLPANFDRILHDACALHTPGGVPIDWVIGLEFLWDLARHGLIAITTGPFGEYASAAKPYAVLTERGRRVLCEERASIYDSTRYVDQLRKSAPNPDAIVLSYVREAIGAWEAALYKSSVVMLGCACERLVILIADAVVFAGVEPYAGKLSKMLAPPKPAGISEVFEQVRGAIEAKAEDKQLGDLADRVDRKLSDLDAEAGLLLFPGFYEFSRQLIAKLEAVSQ
jgi:hypothetical protein